MPRLLVGTSGWNYHHWKGIFYPDGLSERKWLEHYAEFFNSVELNVTFYRLVQKKTFQNWYKRTPEDFYFVVKGSRFITHVKKLKEVEESLDLFLENVCHLKGKLAAVLWLLAPSFKRDLKRLGVFLGLLEKINARQVFEFRHESWFDEGTYELLKRNNACLCIAHSGFFPCVKMVTADFIYLRFHGEKSLYGSNYSDSELRRWADFAGRFKDKDIFAFFNNDAQGYAIQNALRFRKLFPRRKVNTMMTRGLSGYPIE